MSLGFLVAGTTMIAAEHNELGGASLLAGALLVGLPILDTTLVLVSRRRDGVSFLTGGRDHLTHRLHRLLRRLGSPRGVALALALAQGPLAVAAILGEELGQTTVAVVAGVFVLQGVAVIVLMETEPWRPLRPVQVEVRDPLRREEPSFEPTQPSGVDIR